MAMLGLTLLFKIAEVGLKKYNPEGFAFGVWLCFVFNRSLTSAMHRKSAYVDNILCLICLLNMHFWSSMHFFLSSRQNYSVLKTI